MARVLLALDGTDLDSKIVDTARKVFGDQAEYLALNVAHIAVPPVPLDLAMTYPYVPTVEPAGGDDADQEASEDARDIAAQSATEGGLVEVEAIGDVGNPTFTIPYVAEEHAADVIVMGTHKRSWLSRLFEPSVAEGVMHQTDIPVMVIRTHD